MGKRVNENWEPRPGDQLLGVVTDAMVIAGTRRGDIDVAVITEVDTGIRYGVWLSRSLLKELFEEKRPHLGSDIVITYVGPVVSEGTGYTYHRYLMDVADPMEPTGRDWIEDFHDDMDKAKHTV